MKSKISKDEKMTELLKYKSLVLATIDYHLENKEMQIKTTDFNSFEHFNSLKNQTEVHFQKGKLSTLKQWFRDLTEMQIESLDFKFNHYLVCKTNYQIDIFEALNLRIEKIIEKGKITTDNQFYDISIYINKLSQNLQKDFKKIELIDKLLFDYESKKSK